MIYLDNAATTKPDERALCRAQEYLTTNYFNPSALYSEGFALQSELKKARSALLSPIADAESFELVFTSCGTEADNQAVFNFGKRGNVVTTAGEHSAVAASVAELKNRGAAQPRFASLKRDGSVDVEELLKLVDDKTSLVSVIHVNNETGAINDINAIARAVKEKNPQAVFHSDGVQAYGKIPFRLSKDIDLYSVSAHKIGGLKGTGALIKKKPLALRPFIFGGGQESGMRSGTENVAGIIAMAEAAKIYSQTTNFDEVADKYEYLIEKLGDIPRCTIIGDTDKNSHFIVAASFAGCKAEILQTMLADENIYIGRGSACSSRHSGNRVLGEMGLPQNVIDGTLRFSLSPENTKDEIDAVAKALAQKIQALRGNKIG